jgi:hypothetical protein
LNAEIFQLQIFNKLINNNKESCTETTKMTNFLLKKLNLIYSKNEILKKRKKFKSAFKSLKRQKNISV